MSERYLTPKQIAAILQIGTARARRLFAEVEGVVVLNGGGLSRRRKEVRVPAPVFEQWLESHSKRSRSTAASRSL